MRVEDIKIGMVLKSNSLSQPQIIKVLSLPILYEGRDIIYKDRITFKVMHTSGRYEGTYVPNYVYSDRLSLYDPLESRRSLKRHKLVSYGGE